MKSKKGLVDTPVIIGGLVAILVIGLFITILVGVNSKISTSLIQNAGTSATTEVRNVIGNSTSTINSSYSLASNLPLIIVAVLMIMVLLGVGYSIM